MDPTRKPFKWLDKNESLDTHQNAIFTRRKLSMFGGLLSMFGGGLVEEN